MSCKVFVKIEGDRLGSRQVLDHLHLKIRRKTNTRLQTRACENGDAASYADNSPQKCALRDIPGLPEALRLAAAALLIARADPARPVRPDRIMLRNRLAPGTAVPPVPRILTSSSAVMPDSHILCQDRRELGRPVWRVVPAREPDAGLGQDSCQRFKYPPSDHDAVRLPAFLVCHGKAGMRASQLDQHDPNLLTAWSWRPGPVPGVDPTGAHFRGLALMKVLKRPGLARCERNG